MTNGDLNDINRRTTADKLLRNKVFNIAKNPKYDGYQRRLALVVYKFFDKKTSDGTLKNEIMSNKELAEELFKPVFRKFENRKVHSPFIDNIQGADLAYMQLISKFNKRFGFLLCVIDIYSKYVCVIPLKYKKKITITKAFQKIVDELKRKLNQAWVEKGSRFYNRSIKSWLEKKNDSEI